MATRSTIYLLLPVAALALGCGDNLSPGPVIETRLAQATVVAGEVVEATCEITDDGAPVFDLEGVPVVETTPLTITYQQEASFGSDASGAVIAIRAGMATVRCAAPELALVDETPEPIEIVPGPIVRIVTQLDADWTYAGQPIGASCIGFDAFDNPVTDFPHQIVINPSGGGTTVQPGSVTATIAGSYEVSCVVPNIATVDQAQLLVLPALPATVVGRLEPERPVYTVDQQVQIIADAFDMFGNRVDDASFAYTASPTISSPSEARYHFTADGSYTLTATVTSSTYQNIPLSVSIPVIVNTSGPMIECMRATSPQEVNDAYQITQGPGTLTVPVRTSDAFAVQSVTIGGQTGSYSAASGNWTAGVPIGFGINFVDVVAVDEHGLENSTTCFISAAAYYTPESNFIPNDVALRLDPRAISDSNPAVLDSLNDILQTVIRSDELLGIVDAGLSSANPINDGSCGFFACEPDVNYVGGSIGWNQPSSTMSLIANGLRVAVRLPAVQARVTVCGTSCCPGGTTVDINVSAIDATIDFNLFLQSGVLRATLKSGSPTVTVGTVSLNGSGFCGFIAETLDGIFQSTLQSVIRDALTSYIQSDLAPILDGVVSSLDVNTLGATFTVPQLDGTGTVSVLFGLQLSSLNITTSRFLLGIGTRFTPGAIAHFRTSLGIGRQTQNPLLDPPGTSVSRPVGLSFYEGAMNHMLHALWRAGFFRTTLQLGGGTAVIDAKLPPMMAFAPGNQANLAFGGLQSTITIPGIITNLQVTFGGHASAAVTLSGNDLAFGTLTINGLYASFAKPLTQNQRNALEDFLRDVLQIVLADAISDGLPAIPIPSFTLPASVAAFGLPAGAELGIVNPLLSTSGSHIVLTGSFGRRN